MMRQRNKQSYYFFKVILNQIIYEKKKWIYFKWGTFTWPGEVNQYPQVMIRVKLGSLSCQAFPPTFNYRSLVWIPDVNNITEFILQMEQK